MSLREILQSLSAYDKKLLIEALESGIPSYVEYEKGKYIGVLTISVPTLKPTETHGDWACGDILAS